MGTRQKYYELGEKAHKILSWLLKAEESTRTIIAIQTETAFTSQNPTFKLFYANLYKSEQPNNFTHIDNFQSKIEWPKIREEDQKNLDLPFTQAEVIKALNSLQWYSFICKDPSRSLIHLQDLLNTYGTFSGYKVNVDKSEILPLIFNYSVSQSASTFKWVPNGTKYLGIVVDNNFKNLYKLSYSPLLKMIDEDHDKWINLPITLIGRIHFMKINIFPRLQHIFQSLTIPLPHTFFKIINRNVRRFLWNNKVPRISLEKLIWNCKSGGTITT